MRSLVLVATFCLVVTACNSSDGPDRASTFTGRWGSQGALQTMLLPVTPVLPGFVPANPVIIQPLDIASIQPNLLAIGPLPYFGGIGPVELRVVDDSSLVGVPFTSDPVPVTCPPEVAATCATPTAVVTLEGAMGTLSGGILAISIHGQSTSCCSTERFVYGLMAVRQ